MPFKNKEEGRAYQKAWHEKNKEKYKAQRKIYNEANKEKILAWRKAYHDANKEKLASHRKSYRAVNKNKLREAELKRNYGICHEEQKNMYVTQGGVCAICGYKFTGTKDMHIDHCHKTGKVRQLLCPNCNLGLGKFKDDISIVLKAAEYLNKWKD